MAPHDLARERAPLPVPGVFSRVASGYESSGRSARQALTGGGALGAGDVPGVYHEQVLVRSMLDVLGLDPASEQWRGQAGIGAGASGAAAAEHSALDALVRAVLSERAAARAAKDWARADELRDRLAAAGITVADGRDGATWSVG